MNLLTDQWIPVRPIEGSGLEKINLQRLLCEDSKWELCLPRDDMELAALQFLICITQVILTPKDVSELRHRIANRITKQEYDAAIKLYFDWFCLDHPQYPFMQVRGVSAKDTTSMDKLFAGLTGATNCSFVNASGLARQLCGGCTCIALFNLGSCSPSFGGGFKPGLRGPASPITTLIQGRHLRETVWLNVINEGDLERIMPWYKQTRSQKTTWINPIKAGEKITAQQIGLTRGLFWQPARVEVLAPLGEGVCACCGLQSKKVYASFNKAKFNYSIIGTWPHPHSPLIMRKKKDAIQERFASFGTSSAPSWTQLARLVVRQQIDDNNNEGHQPAAVIQQVQKLYGQQAQKLHLAIGGYLNRAGQASVVGRCHEVFTLNHGWDRNTKVIYQLVFLGRSYQSALYKSLRAFVNGIKKDKIKGSGIALNQAGEAQFYRRSEPTIEGTLARINFENPGPQLASMRQSLKQIVEELYEDLVQPYMNDPELIRTRAVARRILHKHLNDIEPQNNEGGSDGTTEIP